MGSAPPSPSYGKRLLPVEIDRIAQTDPGRVLFYTPRNNQPSQGYEKVTTSGFANAINRLCWWLESEKSLQSTSKTIGYIGQNDIRYLILIVAATKVAHKVLLSSPRNSVEGHLSLIRQSGCQLWMTSSGIGNLEFCQKLQLHCLQIPHLDELLGSSAVKPYPYNKEWQDGRSDVLALLHTTGSTGLPRLLPLTLESVSSGDALNAVETIQGKLPSLVEWAGTKMLCAMPLFHIAGLSFAMGGPVFFGWSIVFPPTGPVMQHSIEETLDNIRLDSAFVSPIALSDMAKSPSVLRKLSKLKFISSAGGPTPPAVGKIIHSHVSLWQTMGMTEGLVVPSVLTHNEWAYFHFHPCSGYEMRPYSDTLFELVFVKKEELAATQTIFVTFPDLDTYETKDLYSRHPTKPELYKYEARKDDLVILSNGEKLNPSAVEFQLASHPCVSAAYVAGRDRFQVSLLLNPKENQQASSDSSIIDTVWPAIVQINQLLPAFAQIHRDFVRIVRSPFPRTPKGTVARYEMEKVFAEEIESIYNNSDPVESPAESPGGCLKIDGSSEDAVFTGVRQAIQSISPSLDLKRIGDDSSILSNGFDSLQVVRLARLLSSTFTSPIQVSVGTIYANPSVNQLAHTLWKQLQNTYEQNGPETQPGSFVSQNDVSLALTKYLPSLALSRKQAQEFVVLTGTTGIVGSYVLDALCKNPRVARVWCLNRSTTADAACRQAELAKARGLSLDWKGKVRFLQMNLASSNLGLSNMDVTQIQDQATTIIHNAWEVNFNLPLSAFDTQLTGVQSLVKMCANSRHTIRFFFVSSTSAAMAWPVHLLGPVPEAKLTGLNTSVNGYGASKLVAEHLLSKAAQSGVLHCSVLRVGQVAGPVESRGKDSVWTRRDWVPAIIDASAYLTKLPADLGSANTLDWVPVDLLAKGINQLVCPDLKDLGYCQEIETYYNLVNPQTVSWGSVVPTIQSRLEANMSPQKVKTVPFTQWLEDLEKAEESILEDAEKQNGSLASQTRASRAQTALKLLPFLKKLSESPASHHGTENNLIMPNIITKNVSARSHVFADLPPVSSTWVQTWLNQWGY